MLNVIVLIAMAVTAAAFAAGLTLQAGLPLLPVLIGTAALFLVMAASFFAIGRGSKGGGGDRINELEEALEIIDTDLQRLDKVEDGLSRVDGLSDRVEQLDQAVSGGSPGEAAGLQAGSFAPDLQDVYARIEAVRAEVETENRTQREKIAGDLGALEGLIKRISAEMAAEPSQEAAIALQSSPAPLEMDAAAERAPEPEPEPDKQEPDPISVLELEPEPEPVPDPDALTEAQIEPEAEPVTEPVSEPEPEPEPVPDPDALTEAQIEPEAESVTEPVSEAEPEPVPDPDALTEAQIEPEAESATEPVSEPEPEEELVLEVEQSAPPGPEPEEALVLEAEPEAASETAGEPDASDDVPEREDVLLAAAALVEEPAAEEQEDRAQAEAPAGFMDDDDEDAAMLEIIRGGIEQGRVDLYLQPTVTLPDRKVRYFEALTRLRKTDDGLVKPSDYMPVAKRSALMPLIDNVLVVRSVQVLRRLGPDAPVKGVFANVSMHSLLDPDYYPELIEFMEENNGLSESLIFQINQSEMQGLTESELSCLDTLGALGFTFCLDNVGEMDADFDGLSARYFRYVKVSATSFLGGPGRNAADLKRRLDGFGMQLIVQTVEKESDIAELLDHGVELAQGNLFAEALPMNAALSRELENSNAT